MGNETEKQGHDINSALPFSELSLSNGFLFGEVMQDEDTCRTVLEIILRRPVSRVVYVNKEKQIDAGTQYHKYKGIRLDVYFRDEENTRYCVDMQNQNRYNLPRRSRHYQGVMDVQMMPAGEIDYNKLYDSIVIFICMFDPFGKGRIFYTFKNMCLEEPGLALSDGAVKIFLNTGGTGNSEEDRTLVEFLRYVADKDSPVKSPAVKKIKRRVEEVKRNQETEARYMTSLTHAREIYEDGKAIGEALGLAKGKILSILNLLGDVPEPLQEKISKEENLETLRCWVKLAAQAKSFADFEENM